MRDSFGSYLGQGPTTAASAEAERRKFAAESAEKLPGKPGIASVVADTPFFTIWREYGPSPTVKHYSIQSVEDEAARLSQANPGAKFYVMASLAAVVTAQSIKPPVIFTRAY